MADAMRTVLQPLAKKAAKRVRRAADGDADGVHDARTALRRLRVGLDIMGRTVFEPAKTAKLAAALQRIEQTLGPTRDDDVLIADLDDWITSEGAGQAKAAAALREKLTRRREEDARALSRALDAPKTRRVLKRLRRWLEGQPRDVAAPPKNPAKASRRLVRHFVHDESWRAYEEILAYELRQPADFDVVHKVRSACRRLRFTLELFADALRDADRVIDAMRELQTRLGDLHDDVVGIACIEHWVKTRQIPKSPAVDAYVARRIRSRDRLRAEFDREWRALTSEPLRAALFGILSGKPGKRGSARAPLHVVPAARAA
jgi:CHAD domain-containing protein